MFSDLIWSPHDIFPTPLDCAQAGEEGGRLVPLKPHSEIAQDRNFILSLEHGKVIGDTRLVSTRSNRVIGQLQSLLGIPRPSDYWTVRQKRLRWTRQVAGTSFLLGVPAGHNYYHWLFEALPRLCFLAQTREAVGQIDHFLIGETLHPFHDQTLTLLGIPPQKRIRCSKSRVFECETLLVPPMPNRQPDRIAAWTCGYLRDRFLDGNTAAPGNRLVYLSRRNARKRRLENEREIEALLSARGFEIVLPESLSFLEQVNLFSAAGIIVGPHGAGFANVVFANAGTRILELFHPDHCIDLYEGLCSHQGCPYQGLVGEGERGAFASEQLGPYVISPEAIVESLRRWGY
jgi:capsular polysaccharide biosynthesis protein